MKKMFKKVKNAFLLLLVAVTSFCSTVHAQFDGGIPDPYNGAVIGMAAPGGSIALAQGATVFVSCPAGNSAEITASRKMVNIVRLVLYEETTKYLSADFTASVPVKIEYGPNASSLQQHTQTFTVSYSKADGAKYNSKNYFSFEGAAYVRVTIMNNITPVSAGNVNMADIIYLENEMRVTRYCDLQSGINPVTFTGPASATNPVDAIPVSWSWPVNAGNNATQLEWSWLEDELQQYYFVNGSLNYDLLFKNNATRVDLPYNKSSFNIPLFYDGVGKLYYRIRPVNIKANGIRQDGQWTIPNGSAGVCTYGGHNNALNWQVRTSFAEEGKMKSTIEYLDGSFRSRQTVTKETVNNTTITAETFYDYEGRPAIQVLPAPGINNVVKYQAGLNLFNTQTITQNPADFFDLSLNTANGAAIYATADLSTNSGAARYYSPLNDNLTTGANENIPDAKGYPYTVTRYMPDASGAVLAQSSVGDAHKMGSGREMRYYYGTPGQEELDGLFGTEVGYKSHYFKKMARDANGQMSVSYSDMNGHIIATALAGDAPGNPPGNRLMAINNNDQLNYPNQGGTDVITRNLLDKNTNIEKGNAIESINMLLVPAPNSYTFKYLLTPQSLDFNTCAPVQPICYECLYDLEISITDESGEQAPYVYTYKNLNLTGTVDDNCNTHNPFISVCPTCPAPVNNEIIIIKALDPGSYAIRKTLTLSESSLQQYKDLYLQPGIGICKTEQEIIDSVYNVMAGASNCNAPVTPDCQRCLNQLPDYATFRTNYLNSINHVGIVPAALEIQIQTEYDVQVQNCNNICGTTPSQLLRGKRQLMLADMMPYGGQYATDVPVPPLVPGSGTSMFDKYNIFTTAFNPSLQPYYKKPKNGSGGFDFYHDQSGNVDPQIHPDGTLALLNILTPDDFTNRFINNWADALLPYHPEYPRLLFSEITLASPATNIYNWINTFNSYTTYAAAQNTPPAGHTYIMVSSATITDPFYTIATSLQPEMTTWITSNYASSGFSLWQIARGQFKCQTAADKHACFANGGVKIPPFADVTTTADKDMLWQNFRNLYANARAHHVNSYIVSEVPLSDDAELINQGYQLRFGTNNQTATQNGWTWYPSSIGAPPPGVPSTGVPPSSGTATYTTNCQSYIEAWKQSLMQCGALASMSNITLRDQILNEITTGMVAVCVKGSDPANPYGSSTVKPSTPVDGSPRSFEQVINQVYANYGINPPKDYYCNPYVIEFPKPYGRGPKFSNEVISAIDTCNCSRFTQLKGEASAAGYNPNSLTSLNQYFSIKYGETLPQEIYDALQHCSELGSQVICHTEYETVTYQCDQPNPCLVSRSAGTDSTKKRQANKLLPGLKKPVISKGDSTSTKFLPPWCMVGYHWDFGLQQCVPDLAPLCRDGYHWDFGLNQCVPDEGGPLCPDGYHWDFGLQQCVPDNDPWCEAQCPTEVCDTVFNYHYPLSTPQLIPEFLKCGFIPKKCLTCDSLIYYTNEFKAIFGIPYNGGPNFIATNLTPVQIEQNILFSRFLNFRTGFQFSWMEYAQAAAAANCNALGGGSGPQTVICRDTRPLNDTTGVFVLDTPCHRIRMLAISLAQNIYQQQLLAIQGNFEKMYRDKCMAAKNIETFTVAYSSKEYHYTLFYYDMSGSLVKTVPPKGVRPDYSPTFLTNVKNARDNCRDNGVCVSTAVAPAHVLVTNCRYNSLGKVIAQNTPDAGTSKFWYDRLGRSVVSQNAQQALPSENKYTYTVFDALGRIIETGQKPQTTGMTQTISQDDASLSTWITTLINGGGLRTQITYTGYDAPYGESVSFPNGIFYGLGLNQRNMRNRLSFIYTKNGENDGPTPPFYTGTFYTYDILGHVDTLLQDFSGVPEMQSTNNSQKRVVYDYDLISGKPNRVSYQADWYNTVQQQWITNTDKFYHQYKYDGENRLTEVWTSRDNIEWERDATYNYYKHGSLSRTLLGQLQVQGVDYAYTIDGWVKGVNGTMVSDGAYDMGKDGLINGTNSKVARDIYGYALHYFDDGGTAPNYEADYKSIGATSYFARPNNPAFVSLYNGNIAAMSVNNAGLLKGPAATTNALPLFYNYRYDQLNRIKSMTAYKGLNASNQWVPVTLSGNNDYGETANYDPNGNITGYTRNATGTITPPAGFTGGAAMDDLTYEYYPNTNQLKRVTDGVADNAWDTDINSQTNTSNYTYDVIGNLKSDFAEHITDITWTMYGKISSIKKDADNNVNTTNDITTVSYTYDAMGNRITKTVTPPAGSVKTTIYVRDATGHVMSVYEKETSFAIKQTELYVYGSSRIGMVTERLVAPVPQSLTGGFGTATISVLTRHEKLYELSNHLDNVLVTISDKKKAIDAASDGTIDYYEAVVVTATDYYPFGMDMPGRKYGSAGRYGFNGKERDNDLHSLTAYDYGFRIYNPAIGKFLSVDPLTNSYPALTPYQFASNSPLLYIDVDGLEGGKYAIPGKNFASVLLPTNAIVLEKYESDRYWLTTNKNIKVPVYRGLLRSFRIGESVYTARWSADGKAHLGYMDQNKKWYNADEEPNIGVVKVVDAMMMPDYIPLNPPIPHMWEMPCVFTYEETNILKNFPDAVSITLAGETSVVFSAGGEVTSTTFLKGASASIYPYLSATYAFGTPTMDDIDNMGLSASGTVGLTWGLGQTFTADMIEGPGIAGNLQIGLGDRKVSLAFAVDIGLQSTIPETIWGKEVFRATDITLKAGASVGLKPSGKGVNGNLTLTTTTPAWHATPSNFVKDIWNWIF